MDIKDALTISGFGVAVVFAGLLLTNLMIYSFSLPQRLAKVLKRKNKSVLQSQNKTKEEQIPTPPVNSDIIAVITTVLEVELRLRTSLLE